MIEPAIVFGIPVDFILFALTLLGVALIHRHTLPVALTGLAVIIVWFGSSAGVALANMYPEAKSVGRWVTQGWFVTVAYVFGFFIMLAVVGWHPDAPLK